MVISIKVQYCELIPENVLKNNKSVCYQCCVQMPAVTRFVIFILAVVFHPMTNCQNNNTRILLPVSTFPNTVI